MIGSCLNRIIIYTFLGIALLCSCEKKMKVVKNENYEQFAGKMIVMPTSRMKAVYNGEMVSELPIKHFPPGKSITLLCTSERTIAVYVRFSAFIDGMI